MLDTIVNHCIRIDFDKLVKDDIKANDNIDDDDDVFKNINELTEDKVAEKLTQVMRNTTGGSSRFRQSNKNNQFSKFVLTNTYASTGLSKDTLISNVTIMIMFISVSEMSYLMKFICIKLARCIVAI